MPQARRDVNPRQTTANGATAHWHASRVLSSVTADWVHSGMKTDAQVSTRLKLGVMWDHNGTYMDGIGFQYRDHQVTVDLSEDGQLAGE